MPGCLTACAAASLILHRPLQGSHLEKRRRGCCCGFWCCGRRVYFSLCRLLFGACCWWGRLDQFPLPTRYNANGVQDDDGIASAGQLLDLTVCGCINIASIYTPIVREAQALGRQVYLFHYDWRRSPAEAGARLEAFLTDVLEDCGYDGGAQVLCHSNGATVSWPVVNRRPDLVHSVVFAAGALRGGLSALHEMSEPTPANTLSGNRTMLKPANWFGW